MHQNSYKLVFTRDQSLMIVEAWDFAHNNGVASWFDGKIPTIPPLIFYMLDGAIEEWHSVVQYDWIRDTIQKHIRADRNFIHNSIVAYKNKLNDVKTAWRHDHLGTVRQLKKFLDDLFAATPYFPVWYYAAGDERTPHTTKDEAMDVRARDVFYDECDRIVRNTLKYLYPALNGLESTILKSEIRNIPPIGVLKKRKEQCIFIPGNAAKCMSVEQFLRTNPRIKFLDESKQYKQTKGELTGETAYAGYARGVVRVVRRLDQMDKVETGDILVSPMTTPNFLPAMKKASAFVTDEGGLTCHAAIVAREMKKPCIVGTRIATKVLKDGDRVEVDSNRGIVRKL